MAQGRLILVVDDQKGMRLLFEEVLIQFGYRVATVGSGEEALIFVAETQPDLVLLDMRMPGLSGPETLLKLRAQHPTLPVIMVTADMDDANWAKVEKLGVQGKLHKPFDLNDLVSLVAEVLAQQ
ncbi:MAG: response regulator [Firmicutes bacterium]|nr:response regulator [Bacillota bacterium]